MRQTFWAATQFRLIDHRKARSFPGFLKALLDLLTRLNHGIVVTEIEAFLGLLQMK
jgi:hypothetical protein